jgi:autotransporter-associated beta strand protein
MKSKYLQRCLLAASITTALAATAPLACANDWSNPGLGDWADSANWIGGVPNNAGGWAIGNVQNGGTAIISSTVPTVSEAWAGNNGGVGNIIVTNGGTLNVANWLVVARNGGGGNTPLSLLRVDGGTVNKTGDGFIVGDPANCRGEFHITGSGIVNVTGGWFGVGNDSGWGWVYLRDNAQLLLSDGRDFNIGDWGANTRGWCYMQDNARIDVRRFWVGKNDTMGVMVQSGGIVQGYTPTANEWRIGEGANAYGFYQLTGGTFNNPNNLHIGASGKGLWYQSGGTATFTGWTAPGRYASGWGIVYLTGGSMVHNGTGPHLFCAEQGHGEISVSGSASLDCNLSLVVAHGYDGANGDGYCNLNGGTLSVPAIEQWGTGMGHLSLNGGTIKAKASTTNFLNGLMDTRIFSGGVTFDTDGKDIRVNQALMAAAGNGVMSIPVATPGSGYIAPPIVQISGDGYMATAVAQIDAAGAVTGIVVTCPGYYYFNPPTVTLVGGGASTPATAGTPALGAVSAGNVTKIGAGTLTLGGANDYTSATIVSAGRLINTTDAYGAAPVTVANGAGYGVQLSISFGQLNLSSLTLGTTDATTLDFDVGGFGNPVVPPLNVTGNLALNGTVTVNIADALPQIGLVPLMQYGGKTGPGNFVLGTLPAGVQATLVHDTTAKTLFLNITGVGLPRWDGTVDGVWDIATTSNWVEQSTSLPTVYKDGAPVLFDDQALGTTSVTLGTTVQPSGVALANSTLTYSLTGAGKISGTTAVTKSGTGTFTLATGNDYTGPTYVNGGTLAVSNLANGGTASAIGKSSAAATNLVLAGGTLSYAGPATTINRSYLVRTAVGGIETLSDLGLSGNVSALAGGGFQKKGPAKLTYSGTGANELAAGGYPSLNVLDGTVLFDGSAGSQVNHVAGEMWVGGSATTSSALVLSNTTLNVDSWFALGRGNGALGLSSTATLYNSALRSGASSLGYDGGLPGNLQSPVMTLNGTSTFTNTGDMNLGESSGSSATVNLKDSSIWHNTARVHVGWHNNATGAIVMAQSSKLAVNAWFSVGHEGGIGTFTMNNNSSAWILWDLNITDVDTGDGTMNLNDNAEVSFGSCFIGKGVGSTGLVNQNGGLAYGRPDGNEWHIGFHGAGTWNLTGGSMVASNHWFIVGRWADGPGVLNVSGGAVNHYTTSGKLIRVGEDGTGILNVSGAGSVTSLGTEITVGWNATGNGTINLNGGTLQARRIIGGAGTSALNFNSGKLIAGPNANADFLSALTTVTVQAGGAVIDTGAQNLGIGLSLLDGGGNGGLTKLGTGTLALLGANTYTGATMVNEGTLAGTGIIAGSVTVASGATLAPGLSIGTLTVNGALALNAGCTTYIEVNKTDGTSDQVAGTSAVAYGGTLVLKNLAGQLAVGDTFTLFPNGTRTGLFSTVLSDTPGQSVTWDTTQLTVNGTVKVATAVPAPVTLVPVVSGGNMTLAWPLNQIGWELQTQANPLSIGVSNNWVTVPGSTLTNTVVLPVNPAAGATFFRLVFP